MSFLFLCTLVCERRLIGRTCARNAEKFETRDVRWAPDGKGMVLLDRETVCCAFEVEEEGQEGRVV